MTTTFFRLPFEPLALNELFSIETRNRQVTCRTNLKFRHSGFSDRFVLSFAHPETAGGIPMSFGKPGIEFSTRCSLDVVSGPNYFELFGVPEQSLKEKLLAPNCNLRLISNPSDWVIIRQK